MRLNPPNFTGSKVEGVPQGFIDEMEKIFRVMYATNLKGVEFATYQLKNMAYQWYEEWEGMRGDNAESVMLDEFLGDFLNHFFSQDLGEAKTKDFVNLKQGNMSVKDYALKFQQLSRYALKLVYNMRSRMRKFDLGLSRDLVLECKPAMLNNDMDTSRLIVYMQQVKDEKKIGRDGRKVEKEV